MKIRAAIIAVLLSSGATSALAQDLHENIMEFNLFNESSLPIVEFTRVNYENRWTSDNWLQDYVMPGAGLTLNSNDEYDDRCEIATRIRLEDGSVYEPTINYCGMGAIYVTDTEVTWE